MLMKSLRMNLLALLALVSLAGALAAAGRKPAAKESDASESPIKATLVAKKATYTLDLDGKTSEDFQKLLKETAKAGKAFPPAPAVDLALELKNTTDKEVQLWVGGDRTALELDLKGKGAESVVAQRFFTRIFIGPKVLTLAAGKSHTIPIKALQYGFRGMKNRAYWTQAGTYTVTARFQTAINPAPKDSKDAGDGFGLVTLNSNTVKLTVKAK